MDLSNVKFLTDRYQVTCAYKTMVHNEIILIDKNDIEQQTNNLKSPYTTIRLCQYVHDLSPQKNKDRGDFYHENPNGIKLMSFFNPTTSCAYCRERSILLHILLAQLGIVTVIISAETESGERHSFLIDECMNIYDPMHINPTTRTISSIKISSGQCFCLEESDKKQHCYNKNIEFQQIVSCINKETDTTINYSNTLIKII